MTYRDLLRGMRVPFPRLTESNSRPTSPYDEGYNCIAWAAGDTLRWWWPDPMGLKYWPADVPRSETMDSFVKAYGTQGYLQLASPELESGKQKVAIFADRSMKPTHAARQLVDGWWASKLGAQIDIEHELSALDGPAYGTVAVILARPAITDRPDPPQQQGTR